MSFTPSPNVWQQVLAVDARYNIYRTPNNVQFRTQYIRRRIQLLQQNAKNTDPSFRKQYLKIRSRLLAQKYGPVSEASSMRSTSMHGSTVHLEQTDSDKTERQNNAGHGRVVPTKQADASRAMVGGTSVGENYAFTGMHHIFDDHIGSAVTAVKFANDEKDLLAYSSMNGKLCICETHPDAKVKITLTGHTDGVTDFSWSLSNDLIVSVSLDASLKLWETGSGQCLRNIPSKLVGLDNCAMHCCLFQPVNNNMVVVGNNSGQILVINISTGKSRKGANAKLVGAVLSMSFDSSGKILWAGSDQGTICSFVFDLATSQLRRGHQMVIKNGVPLTCIHARSWMSREARDPSVLVNVSADLLSLYRVVDDKGRLQHKRSFQIKHSQHLIRSMFCPLMSFRQGACVVTGSEDMNVWFFDIERAHRPCVNKLQGHASPVVDVSFNFDESMLASCDAEVGYTPHRNAFATCHWCNGLAPYKQRLFYSSRPWRGTTHLKDYQSDGENEFSGETNDPMKKETVQPRWVQTTSLCLGAFIVACGIVLGTVEATLAFIPNTVKHFVQTPLPIYVCVVMSSLTGIGCILGGKTLNAVALLVGIFLGLATCITSLANLISDVITAMPLFASFRIYRYNGDEALCTACADDHLYDDGACKAGTDFTNVGSCAPIEHTMPALTVLLAAVYALSSISAFLASGFLCYSLFPGFVINGNKPGVHVIPALRRDRDDCFTNLSRHPSMRNHELNFLQDHKNELHRDRETGHLSIVSWSHLSTNRPITCEVSGACASRLTSDRINAGFSGQPRFIRGSNSSRDTNHATDCQFFTDRADNLPTRIQYHHPPAGIQNDGSYVDMPKARADVPWHNLSHLPQPGIGNEGTVFLEARSNDPPPYSIGPQLANTTTPTDCDHEEETAF